MWGRVLVRMVGYMQVFDQITCFNLNLLKLFGGYADDIYFSVLMVPAWIHQRLDASQLEEQHVCLAGHTVASTWRYKPRLLPGLGCPHTSYKLWCAPEAYAGHRHLAW